MRIWPSNTWFPCSFSFAHSPEQTPKGSPADPQERLWSCLIENSSKEFAFTVMASLNSPLSTFYILTLKVTRWIMTSTWHFIPKCWQWYSNVYHHQRRRRNERLRWRVSPRAKASFWIQLALNRKLTNGNTSTLIDQRWWLLFNLLKKQHISVRNWAQNWILS
jgi:hypothetical protein